jgi:DMSO/TMAO reductase YedYZ molybdopterin-dependent catalytic subunit
MFDSIFRRREEEQALKRAGRIPPGQSLTNKFPVLHYGPIPSFNPATWDFRVWGEVEQPLRLTWQEFSQLPRTSVKLDLHCVTKWSKVDTLWEGVTLQTMINLGLFKPKPLARFVLQHAEYGYTTNLPLDVSLQENFLLATHYNGAPVPVEHGYPLRAVIGAIPGRDNLKTPYLWKGAKWLRGLEFLSQDQRGFWEDAGYHNEADVWREERFS